VQCPEKEEVQKAFRSKIMELNEGTSVNEESQKGIEKQWSICEKIVKEAAESVIGMQGPPQRNDWFGDECAAATSLKNKAYKNMLDKKNTRGAREEYQRRRYEEKKIHRRKKREAWKVLMEEMEEAGRQKVTRKFYRKVNIIRKGYEPRIGMCKDKNENLVTEKKKVLQRWAEHFDELLVMEMKIDIKVIVKVKLRKQEEAWIRKKTRNMEQIETWKRRTYLQRRK